MRRTIELHELYNEPGKYVKNLLNTNDLDSATAALIRDAPFFRERYELARRKLYTARENDGGMLTFPDGYACGPGGCTCQEAINCVCVHQAAWRIHTGATS
jgi:hypothetical protein